jgi:hypothetical protein
MFLKTCSVEPVCHLTLTSSGSNPEAAFRLEKTCLYAEYLDGDDRLGGDKHRRTIRQNAAAPAGN